MQYMLKFTRIRRRHLPRRSIGLDDPRPPMPRMRYP
jgi:hypothetical protein